ncbi:MAG TPA: hypothetical protein VGE32_14875, partial [Cellvibrio sp.]
LIGISSSGSSALPVTKRQFTAFSQYLENINPDLADLLGRMPALCPVRGFLWLLPLQFLIKHAMSC